MKSDRSSDPASFSDFASETHRFYLRICHGGILRPTASTFVAPQALREGLWSHSSACVRNGTQRKKPPQGLATFAVQRSFVVALFECGPLVGVSSLDLGRLSGSALFRLGATIWHERCLNARQTHGSYAFVMWL